MNYRPIGAINLPTAPTGGNLGAWASWTMQTSGVLLGSALNWVNQNALLVAGLFVVAIIGDVFRIRLNVGGGKR